MEVQTLELIIENVERVRRPYEILLRTYDTIALKDLSHALRIWTELKPVLEAKKHPFATSISFTTSKPNKKLLHVLRNKAHVYAAFPENVVTSAHDGNIRITNAPHGSEHYLATRMKLLETGALETAYICVIGQNIEDTERGTMSVPATNNRCSFTQWMGAEAMRVGTAGKLETLVISREMLIKRMANTLGGSHLHTGVKAPEEDKINQFDTAINAAMVYVVAGLPLPYFALLKIAQDILAFAKKKIVVIPANNYNPHFSS